MQPLALFPAHEIKTINQFPQTRYQGSKAKILDWIWWQIKDLSFNTCLDLFGGTGTVAYRLKQEGKAVTYNDYLKFNYLIASALIENKSETLPEKEVELILSDHSSIYYPDFVEKNFHDIYFTDEENKWIDRRITNMRHLSDVYKFGIAFFALAQACIIKRPYNLFHRKNLYVRTADVERSFGNKITWDRSFDEYFRKFALEANQAIFDNGKANQALNLDVFDTSENYDLVYIDSPYISSAGTGLDYHGFYHFLEGLTDYDQWQNKIDYDSKHKRLVPQKNIWNDKAKIKDGFDRLFKKFRESTIVVSYRSDGIPSEGELTDLLKKYKKSVTVQHYGEYKYVLSKNSTSKELLLIGT